MVIFRTKCKKKKTKEKSIYKQKMYYNNLILICTYKFVVSFAKCDVIYQKNCS